MIKMRKAGTLTAGIVFVVFGALFIARNLFPSLNYNFILSLWPVILIILGIEIIISYMVKKEETMKYDGWAIFLIIILAFFSMAMAGAEFVLNHFSELKTLL